MDVNQTSVAFAGAAAAASSVSQAAQQTARQDRDEVARSTANAAAASETEVAEIRADAPDIVVEEPRERPPVAEADDSEDPRPRSERGQEVDIYV